MQDVFLKKSIFLFIGSRQLMSKDMEMPEINYSQTRKKGILAQVMKDSFFLILALVFIALYAAAFAGKLDPLKDNIMLMRIEPVIFILIGYYFGRHPSRQCEETLQAEITRQHHIAQATQIAKESLQTERDRLEEKIENARTAIEAFENSDAKPNRNVLKAVSEILD